jgi:hypothetical protein
MQVIPDTRDGGEGRVQFPVILHMNAESIFSPQLRYGAAVDGVVPVIHPIGQCIRRAKGEAVLRFEVVGLRPKRKVIA